jgi:hypothetical protein
MRSPDGTVDILTRSERHREHKLSSVTCDVAFGINIDHRMEKIMDVGAAVHEHTHSDLWVH